MILDYYWSRIDVINAPKNGAYGWCTYYTDDDYAEVYLCSSLFGNQRFSTFVHELGHVWQGMKDDDLVTEIEWPENHPASLTIREDFPECLRVAVCGLDSAHDESVMFHWVQGVYEPYLSPVKPELLQTLQKQCVSEVIRLLGFMPTIPTI